ncbi:MAG TPA: hypothetical protein VLZ12_07430 [Verrucomicrobiae bacterium]|nr:hypothetical protein [Verrucomicrobiae bacterium]
MKITKDVVLDAVGSLMRQRFGVTGERDKKFDLVVAELYLPTPLNCIVQFDDATHCTRERAVTFGEYPPDAPLNFDVRRYLADQAHGDPSIARADMHVDLLPPKHGLNPTVRIRADELAELSGSLEQRVETLLSRRFAFHAGTVFQNMLENAGAKPHRTHGD